jgi:pyruvate/2-oxoglutarate dehydrogenase complex dihydrolipoamide dehydrogenase (E3) component
MSDAALAVAEALADKLRPSDTVRVEPAVVASALGVRVELRSMHRSVLGATPSDSRVVINEGLEDTQRRFVLAHELAHVLVKRGVAPVDSRNEERFADTFAEALLVPNAALVAMVNVEETACRLGVESAIIEARLKRMRRRVKPRAA